MTEQESEEQLSDEMHHKYTQYCLVKGSEPDASEFVKQAPNFHPIVFCLGMVVVEETLGIQKELEIVKRCHNYLLVKDDAGKIMKLIVNELKDHPRALHIRFSDGSDIDMGICQYLGRDGHCGKPSARVLAFRSLQIDSRLLKAVSVCQQHIGKVVHLQELTGDK